MKRLLAALVALSAFAGAPAYTAESYPGKPVRFIVPFPPGCECKGDAVVVRDSEDQNYEVTINVV
jgi:tripartite-type tricarboxylate transporter receptor subunit TctC